MKLLWLDVETTGLNKEKCDIIQIAGIVVIDGEEKERFNFKCQPINWENIEPTSITTIPAICITYMWNFKKMVQMSLFKKQKHSHRC